jgi:hypothetical protein
LQNGARVLLGTTIEGVEGSRARLLSKAGDRETIEARTFIYSAGYGSRALIRELLGCELPLRYWKSHLVVTKRLGPVGLFFVDPGEAAMMHHGGASIVGLNEDAELSLEANYDVVDGNVENLHRALTRLVPSWHTQGYLNLACVKVDLALQSNSARSLNIAIHHVADGHICVLPGKMTETPYLTDVLVGMVHDRWDDAMISLRPCDRFAANTRWQQDAV